MSDPEELKKEIPSLQKKFADAPAEEILSWAVARFGSRKMAFASSLGAEDQVITDMLVKIDPKASIFTLDTGRFFQETYNILENTINRYKTEIEVLFPESRAVEEMVRRHGPNLFYYSVENRKLCCRVRKVEPLKKKLAALDAWICGLRKGQSVTRTQVEKIEWDGDHGLVKINPIADWSEKEIWDYIRLNSVPYNSLHDKGFPSIGCAPCTRAIQHGEDIRAGRWWWENPDYKECGLHRS